MIEARVYEDENGRRPFERWFDDLPPTLAVKVVAAITRLEGGHTAGLKAVGKGVSEWRIDSGPGLRLYIAFDGAHLIILLGGGSKRRQQADIIAAQERWADYKQRKKKS